MPLEHFLYTGNSTKTSGEMFKLVDSKGALLTTGYKKAMAAKSIRQSDKDKSYGAKTRHRGNAGSDKGLYVKQLRQWCWTVPRAFCCAVPPTHAVGHALCLFDIIWAISYAFPRLFRSSARLWWAHAVGLYVVPMPIRCGSGADWRIRPDAVPDSRCAGLAGLDARQAGAAALRGLHVLKEAVREQR